MSRNFANTLVCESHPNASLIEDPHAGDMICPECGFVVGDRIIDVHSEWRTFQNDTESKDMNRVGAVEDPSAEGHDLTTSIAHTSSSLRNQDGARYYKNFESTEEKTKKKAMRDIRDMAAKLSADDSIIRSAQHIFNIVQKNKLIKGRSNNAIIAACMFFACREQSARRTFKEISAVSNANVKDIARCYQIIRENYIKTDKKIEDNAGLVASGTSDLIVRFCSKLKLASPVRKLANSIYEQVSRIPSISGRSPNSLSAASIYMACLKLGNEKITAEEIGKICGAAENTIKQTYKRMLEFQDRLLPKEFVAATTSTVATTSSQPSPQSPSQQQQSKSNVLQLPSNSKLPIKVPDSPPSASSSSM